MKRIPRYLYRGTSTLNVGGSLLWMHADPDPITGFGERIYFTDSPSKAIEYSEGFWGGNVFGHPLVIRIDTAQEPELRRLLRIGHGEPDEYYIPVGVFQLRHEPLVVRIGKTGAPETSKAPHWVR